MKYLKLLFAVGIMSVSGSARAETRQAPLPPVAPDKMQLCTVDDSAISDGGTLPQPSFYFSKPLPCSDGSIWVVYSTDKMTEDPSNWMINLKTGQQVRMTGKTEAMPIDCKHVSTGETVMRVYNRDDFLSAELNGKERDRENEVTPEEWANESPAVQIDFGKPYDSKTNPKIRPFLFTKKITDSYQSFGVLPKSEVMRLYGNKPFIERSTVYRVLTGRESRLKIWDFRAYRDEQGNEVWDDKLMENPILLCQQYSRTLSLPMISKNGLYFGASLANMKDTDDMEQRNNLGTPNISPSGPAGIYKILMPQGDCHRVVNIGRMTEKIDFNYAENDEDMAIAFTATASGIPPLSRIDPHNRERWSDTDFKLHVHSTYKNAYVYKVKEKKLIQLTQNKEGSGVYSYPSFLQDGRVLIKMTQMRSDGTFWGRVGVRPDGKFVTKDGKTYRPDGFLIADISSARCGGPNAAGKSALADRAVPTRDACRDIIEKIEAANPDFGKSPLTEGFTKESLIDACHDKDSQVVPEIKEVAPVPEIK